MEINEQGVIQILQTIKYPPKDQDIVSLNMVTELTLSEKSIAFTIVFDSFNNPHEKSIKTNATEKLQTSFGNNIEIKIRAIGKVNVNKMNVKSEPVKTAKPLQDVKHIIMVTSGKGGVGKSTVAANLAIALANSGVSVGLLDSDMYGPSIPKMFDIEDVRPKGKKVDGKDVIVPIEKFGVKVVSLGFFIKKEDAVIWRGSMVTNALKQLINDVEWGKLDFMIIDLPPGTGDTQITLAQTVESSGAVVVSTPQTVAINDVRKAVNMFRAKGIEVPVLGMVENMAWFTPDDCPDKKYYIFGKGGASQLANEFQIPVLGEIPIIEKIREDGDSGTPSALNKDSLQGKAFFEIASNVMKQLKMEKV